MRSVLLAASVCLASAAGYVCSQGLLDATVDLAEKTLAPSATAAPLPAPSLAANTAALPHDDIPTLWPVPRAKSGK